jgi:16S rRNA G966 N2-methylase RsmD
MLDLFGGTGSHSYEAISRGCTNVTYVDMHRPAAKFVAQVAKLLDIEDFLTIKLQDVAQFLKRSGDSFDYIFAGPPYPLPWLNQIPDLILGGGFLKPNGLLVLEHNPNHHFESHLNFQELRKYGGTHFSFFTAKQAFDD